MGILWGNSGAIERDNNDVRANGAKAYFFVGGTTTPLTVYEDGSESTPHEHPLEADASGRWPAAFIPFTASYDVKVVTRAGTQLYYYTDIPNPNPVEEAEASVDENALLQTGDWIFTTKSGTRTGFVRANGRTIGSAASGASERANSDTEDLYTFLWNNHADGICAVSGGRGASAAADFAANKAIAVPDARAAVQRGLDDMGNSAAGLLALATFATGDATTGGSVGGANSHALTEAQLPQHSHSVNLTTSADGGHAHDGTTFGAGGHTHTVTDPGHTHGPGNGDVFHIRGNTSGGNTIQVALGPVNDSQASTTASSTTGISLVAVANHTHSFLSNAVAAHTHTVTGATATVGSGSAHNNASKSVLGTFHIKL